jgi:FtsZ-interacting cell division protein YlmF
LGEEDKDFVAAYDMARPLDPKLIEGRINATDLDPAVSRRALDYIRGLTSRGEVQPKTE